MRHGVHTVKYEVSFWGISTSRIICVLRGFLDATSRSPRVLPFQLQFGPQKELQNELKMSLGTQNGQRGSQEPHYPMYGMPFCGPEGSKGSRFEAQKRVRNRVDFWS